MDIAEQHREFQQWFRETHGRRPVRSKNPFNELYDSPYVNGVWVTWLHFTYPDIKLDHWGHIEKG